MNVWFIHFSLIHHLSVYATRETAINLLINISLQADGQQITLFHKRPFNGYYVS